CSPLFPYTTLFRSLRGRRFGGLRLPDDDVGSRLFVHFWCGCIFLCERLRFAALGRHPVEQRFEVFLLGRRRLLGRRLRGYLIEQRFQIFLFRRGRRLLRFGCALRRDFVEQGFEVFGLGSGHV